MRRRVAHLSPPGRRLALLVVTVLFGLGVLVSSASAIPIKSFKALPTSTQAGGHPDISFPFEVENRGQNPSACACQDTKDVIVHLPSGLYGNPHSTPQCTIAQFSSDRCPVDSQVGIASVVISILPEGGFPAGNLAPVFNLVPPPNAPGLLGFKTLYDTPVLENVSARTESDYGVDVAISSISHFFALIEANQVNWGVPAAPIHDYLRFGPAQTPILEGFFPNQFCDAEAHHSTEDPSTFFQTCDYSGGAIPAGAWPSGPGGPVANNSPQVPFFENPTTCGESSLTASLDIAGYDGSHTHAEAPYPATTGCPPLSFNPSQAITPTTTAADTPSGADFRLTVPQFESPSVPSPSELRNAVVTLPAGFALAPNVMNGKTTCSNTEARFGTREEAQCPENAKIGTTIVETPVLPGPLPGAAYLGEPLPGNRYRLFLVFDGFGIHIKLAGTVNPDPQTGEIKIRFEDLPQAPFETFLLHIFGSERGPLATPTRCGTYEVSSHWTPWDSALADQTSRQFFTIDQGPDGQPCPSGARAFHPGFQAASASSTAGGHTPFSINVTRQDGEQNLAGLSVETPPGFSATLKGVPYCPQAAIDQLGSPLHSGLAEIGSPACPPASQVGTVTAGVGAGNHPLYLPGKVYLAGPYNGAPLSLEVVIPAVSGPYDLGTIAVRAAVQIDPTTAQITTVSDSLPQIFGGIPVRARQILINIDRPGFGLNPTNCEPLSVAARLTGDEGGVAAASSHFQVTNCAALPYGPKLTLRLSGGVQRRGHPAIHTELTAKPGEANTAKVAVALPKGELLDNAHIRTPCTKAQLNAGQCPAGSVLGHATADTPLLAQPLEGPVYLVTGFGHLLPDLIVDLNGQFHVQLDGRIDTVNGGALRTTFDAAPDAPISSFSLDLAGGAKGLIQNTTTLCGASKSASVQIVGQNAADLRKQVSLQAACGKHSKRHRRGSSKRGAFR